jgi:hypothetical protein
MGKNIGGEAAGCLLADLFKNNVTQIVEHHLTEPRQTISRYKREQNRQLGAQCVVGHAIDNCLVDERHRENGCLGTKNQQSCDNDPQP